MALCDVSSDGGSTGKANFGEKECILTQMTKKIGLGIYTRRRNATVPPDRSRKEAEVDSEGDERETWYMFYPPPPSPSLALNPQEWDSASSTEIEHKSPTGFDFEFRAEAEEESSSVHSGASRESSYEVSGMGSPAEDNPSPTVDNQAVDINALAHSAENLANQYRDLMHPAVSPAASPSAPISRSTSNAHSMRDVSSIPLPLAISFNLPLPLPLPMPTPKTLRKVKRQHSLRRLNDPYPDSFADFDFNPDLLIPGENGSPQIAASAPSPPLLSPSPDEIPSPNEPEWIMAPFTAAEANKNPPTGMKRRSPQIQPPSPPPRESSKHNRHSRKTSLDKYETGEIPPRPSRHPKLRQPLVRRNASFAGWADAPTFEAEPGSDIQASVSPPPKPPASLPSPPLSPSLSRSKSFVLPSVVLKRQWEDAFHGLPQPQPSTLRLPQAREHEVAYVVVEQSSRGRRRAREKRYGVVVPGLDVDASVNAVENGEAGWL